MVYPTWLAGDFPVRKPLNWQGYIPHQPGFFFVFAIATIITIVVMISFPFHGYITYIYIYMLDKQVYQSIR